jgi:hypothetical protein
MLNVGVLLCLLAAEGERAAPGTAMPTSGVAVPVTEPGQAATSAPGTTVTAPAVSPNADPLAAAPSPAPPFAGSPAELPPPPPPPPPVEPLLAEPRRYGDAGAPELALGIGYSSSAGFLGVGGFRYFVVDGLAPGVEGTYVSGGTSGSAYGFALATLRLVPVRTGVVALVLTGRGGRVFFGDHPDGWGVGGAAGAIIMIGANAGLEIGYEILRLLPSSVCADFDSCVLQGPVLGLRLVL